MHQGQRLGALIRSNSLLLQVPKTPLKCNYCPVCKTCQGLDVAPRIECQGLEHSVNPKPQLFKLREDSACPTWASAGPRAFCYFHGVAVMARLAVGQVRLV